MSLLLSELVRLDGLAADDGGDGGSGCISSSDELQVSFSVLDAFAKTASTAGSDRAGGLYNAFVRLCGKGDYDLTVSAHDAAMPPLPDDGAAERRATRRRARGAGPRRAEPPRGRGRVIDGPATEVPK